MYGNSPVTRQWALFMLAFILYQAAPAQEYNNIITPGISFYSGETNEPGLLSGLRADSVSAMGDGDTLYIIVNTIRPYYDNPQLDVTGGIFGQKVIRRHDGRFQFINNTCDTLLIDAAAGLNESWAFCTFDSGKILQATVTAIQPSAFPGVTDTVKVITFQAKSSSGENITNYYNGRSFQLSRNYGLLQLHDLYRMPDTSGLYTLEGRDSPRIGFSGLTSYAINNFDIGDEFHYEGFDYYLWGHAVAHMVSQEIRRVIGKEVTSHTLDSTVTYTWEHCVRVTDYTPVGTYTDYCYDTIRTTANYTDDLLDRNTNWLPEQFTGTQKRYWTALEHIVPGRAAAGSRDKRYQCCWTDYYGYPAYIKDEYEYAAGLGQVHYENYWEYYSTLYYNTLDLVYYKKGAESWGSPVDNGCGSLVPFFSSSPDTLSLGWESQSTDTLHIRSNRDWMVSYVDSLVTVNPMTGTGDTDLIIRAKKDNPWGWAVPGSFSIRHESEETRIHLVQEANPNLTFSVHPDTVMLAWQNGSQSELAVTSNTIWEIDTIPASWFWVSTTVGTGSLRVTFYANDENPGPALRKAEITFSGPAGEKTIPVIQAGRSTGIRETGTEGLTVTPIPVNDRAIIRIPGLPETTEKILDILDCTGRSVFSADFSGSVYHLTRGDLPAGIYLMRCTSDENPSGVSTRIILQ